MAKQTSRELVLERRKALSQGGKNALAVNDSTNNRVRSAVDSRATRTGASTSQNGNEISTSTSSSAYTKLNVATVSSVAGRHIQRVSRPSRDLVLARREALSRKGKTADTSKDRTRADSSGTSSSSTVVTPSVVTKYCCDECKENDLKPSTESINSLSLSSRRKELTSNSNNSRRATTKRRPIQNSSRALVLARREAQSKHGKTAGKQPTSAASVARQGDPDLTSRELSQRVRELRSKSGASGSKRSGGSRPCGPNKNGSKQLAAADAHWKVGVSETSSGQVVTGTQANRSTKTTGNEASTCRSVTGTQYMGEEAFSTFCQSTPIPSQPLKVAVTNTSHGNLVTGNEVGRSEKVTGNEPGTCKNLTGTEYISSNQSNEYCGGINPSPRKVGHSLTQDGRTVSGVMVGRSSRVTGDEAGSHKGLTGDQYLGSDPLPEGRPAEKVSSFNTLAGAGVTGTNVSRTESVTGNEPGTCKLVTGDEYIGQQQYQSFCGGKPKGEAPKVGLSLTNKSQIVSGTQTGRSQIVTGDEPGTCKAVTGTPYAGLEQASQLCDVNSVNEIQQRTPRNIGTPAPALTGQQPGIGGVMTGADRGACELLTGTPYVGGDQINQACANSSKNVSDSNDQVSLGGPGTQFTVQSPARSAQKSREQLTGVTGTSYENGSRITGPFDMALEKITGTEQFRFGSKLDQTLPSSIDEAPVSEKGSRPISRITGEGQSSGLNITGDDWARGESVTGTEGRSSTRRNPSRAGGMSAMPAFEPKRNEELAKPDLLITGSSGNTGQGQLVTFSGGARG
ncbi:MULTISPECIES: carboxysome assembly protein CsoS2 [Prochlorococcus]|uniref:Carboxysome shell polypeptide, CsoS2 n=1 Tax=Prochlorococcus marinus (strain SARG / CCMP1375 / SS120) TaxID=167539 RepID=Q7VD31_PROMA|nr:MULTISPECIES: CsoS2 family carboxysome shell protein [Prochlorococcus]AAP99598.1 Carboxysome shell polypeptide, CsoS2 [Prochlorococcus marinus subsp. marinus str. CCMP1375]KGG11132.1 carboxysome shell protein CsoS2 [Prochlorococcus marinus str. LG]KGG21470.1 carboxysome shell protein CsoS2 [Prochlorococcus marinus str. SS2]KGG23185.1 carboxysome shell protein CsoS2 [Prochlorococcus marinus str. SS35]KGG33896.1 carboxysome shell protein CsoS2 [Prochlorococcus marinus str. SS51]